VLSADAKTYPFDPPLTDTGLAQAKKVASELSQCGSFGIVVSSPFLRCVQTSIVLADILGARLLIDNGIGEMFTPNIFGEHATLNNPLRTLEGLASALDGIKPHLKQTHVEPIMYWENVVGSPPVWPENEESARRRYAGRFLTYLKRARTKKENYILVGHQGLLEEALHVLPATSNAEITHVDYCATLVAMWPHEPGEDKRSKMSKSSSIDSSLSMLEEMVVIDPLDELSATKTQEDRWEVGVQGIELNERQSVLRRCVHRFGTPLDDLQRLLGKEEQNKPIHGSIGELASAIDKSVHSLTASEVAEHELECFSFLTISEAPMSEESPTNTPTSTKSPKTRKSPFCARLADQASKSAAMYNQLKVCELSMTCSSLRMRRGSAPAASNLV
jgi:broad specificity phosphatase PhoE